MKEKNNKQNGVDIVREYVLSEFKKGEKLPKVSEISDNLGTSKYAVERVMTELSAEGIIKRKPRLGSIVTCPEKQNPKTLNFQAKNIAFMADEIESFLTSELIRGIEQRCREKDLMLSLMNSNYDAETEKKHLMSLVENHCDGAIVRIGEHKENFNILEEVIPKNYPLVLVDRSNDSVDFPCVKMDQEKAVYDATNHLIDLGHTKIGHLNYNEKTRPLLKEMEQRKQGYLNALKDADISVKKKYIQGGNLFELGEKPSQSYWDFIGYEPMNKLLLLPEKPTAVCLITFHFVPGALRAIADHGLKVPEDISLICIDDEPMARHIKPLVTVIAQPLREMGAKALDVLNEKIDGNFRGKRTYELEGQLIIRNSTAKPKS